MSSLFVKGTSAFKCKGRLYVNRLFAELFLSLYNVLFPYDRETGFPAAAGTTGLSCVCSHLQCCFSFMCYSKALLVVVINH